MNPLSWYRSTGADWPYGDPLRAHPGVAMEGYLWRFTDPHEGRVVIALIGVNQGPRGTWSTLGLAGHPTPAMAMVAHPQGYADPLRLSADAGPAFTGDDRRVTVDLGPDARLDVELSQLRRWPNRRFGGSGVFHAVPALNQYWHPWLLGGRADGTVRLGSDDWRLDGAHVYAEKNWGRAGFPDAWWWGQAQGFAEPDACVAFAGGRVTAGRLHAELTALVVALPGGEVIRLGHPVLSPVRTVTTAERWRLDGRSRSWRIRVDGSAPLDGAHVLPVPLPAQHRNTAGDIEHLAARLRVSVRRNGRLVWEGDSRVAALEQAGLERARAELRRRGLPPTLESAPPMRVHRPSD